MRGDSFAKTGNIEMVEGGRRVLIGQLVDGEMRDKESFKGNVKAKARIQRCIEIAKSYGKNLVIVYISA